MAKTEKGHRNGAFVTRIYVASD